MRFGPTSAAYAEALDEVLKVARWLRAARVRALRAHAADAQAASGSERTLYAVVCGPLLDERQDMADAFAPAGAAEGGRSAAEALAGAVHAHVGRTASVLKARARCEAAKLLSLRAQAFGGALESSGGRLICVTALVGAVPLPYMAAHAAACAAVEVRASRRGRARAGGRALTARSGPSGLVPQRAGAARRARRVHQRRKGGAVRAGRRCRARRRG